MTKGEQMMADLGYKKHMGTPTELRKEKDHALFYFENIDEASVIAFSHYYGESELSVRSFCGGGLSSFYGDELLACAEIIKEIKSYD